MENQSNNSSSPMKHNLNTNLVLENRLSSSVIEGMFFPTDKSWSKDSYKPILEIRIHRRCFH